MSGIFLLALLACSAPNQLVQVEGATRLAELANGELLVGTATGQLWIVTSFGEASVLTSVGDEPVVELVSDPLGRYWARMEGGDVYSGDAWSPTARHVGSAFTLVRRCEETQLLSSAEAGAGVSALSLANDSCDALVAGSADGQVDGRRVSGARIVRVQAVPGGVVWVDADTNVGCVGCALPMPSMGIIDALSLHLAPFVAGEFVWIDREGTLWIARG